MVRAAGSPPLRLSEATRASTSALSTPRSTAMTGILADDQAEGVGLVGAQRVVIEENQRWST